MSYSNSPALVLELPRGWQRLIPAGVLLITALLLPWLAFAWSPAMRFSAMSSGLMLAIFAGWQMGLGHAAKQLTRIVWAQNGEWHLQFAANEPIAATLAPGSWWSPWLMCWRFVDASGRKHGLLLWRPEFSAGNWHHWQLRLRLEGTHASTVAVEALR